MKNLNWLKMSGLTNTTMTALKVAMAVAMTFQRETVQQCGGVPLDQLAQLTAQLQPDWLPLQTRPVCRTPPTPTHHPLAHIPTPLLALYYQLPAPYANKQRLPKVHFALVQGSSRQESGHWQAAGEGPEVG